MTTHEIPCNFVACFKIGDNIAYNSEVLCGLAGANEDGLFNKPIVIQVAAILEASLSEIIARAQQFNREGVPNISAEDQREIKRKQIDKFNTVIDVLKKYKVLHGIGTDVYDDLHKLRRYRNKVHIQDRLKIDGASRDEGEVFSARTTEWALSLLLKVLRHLSTTLKRPKRIHGHVRPLQIPS